MGFPSLAQYQAYYDKVNWIIDQEFENVTGLGTYFAGVVKPDQTWSVCTNFNWTKVSSEEGRPTELDGMFEELGIDEFCSSEGGLYRDDATCLAIYALASAFDTLQEAFPEGPKFANYLLVSWGKNPSWVDGAVGPVNYTVSPPRAKLIDGNGANAYGFCDIIRTVLTQSANQMQTGTCSYVASLAALSHMAPALALKMAVRLMWTGRVTPLISRPCEYIYGQQPGLVPFQDINGTWHPDVPEVRNSAGAFCAGNKADCERSAGSPLQSAGLTFMWSQSLLASFYSSFADGRCGSDMEVAQLSYPGISAEDHEKIADAQGGGFGSVMFTCNEVVDPSGRGCRMIFNLDTCGFVNDDDCRLLKSYQIDGPMLNELVQALVVGDENNITDVGVAAADVMDKYKPIKEYVEFYAKIAAETFADHEAGSVVNLVEYQVLRQWSTNWFTPSATEENLVDACSAQVALLFVDAAPLQTADSFIDQPMNSTGSCNHAVYLVDCYPDNNVYTLWTWGSRVNVTKEVLVGTGNYNTGDLESSVRAPNATYTNGILCGAVVADQVTFDSRQRRRNPFVH